LGEVVHTYANVSVEEQYKLLSNKLNLVMNYVRKHLTKLPRDHFHIELNKKPLDSIKRKSLLKKTKNIAALSDLIRGRIFFSTDYSMENVVEMVEKLFKDNINTVDEKRKADGKEYGLVYGGKSHIDLKIDGINFELQIIPIEFRAYQNVLHSIYEKLRPGGLSISERYREFLQNVHNKLSNDLIEISKKHREK
jgi:CheY-specific phosphatase CheX